MPGGPWVAGHYPTLPQTGVRDARNAPENISHDAEIVRQAVDSDDLAGCAWWGSPKLRCAMLLQA